MPNSPGRPSSATYATVTAVHIDTGQALAWSDGVFAGSHDHVKAARAIRAAGDPVTLGSRTYPVDSDTPAAAAAVMLAAFCGRGRLVGKTAGVLGDDEPTSDLLEPEAPLDDDAA